MNITYDSVKEKYGDKADAIWASICLIGGFGDVPKTHVGGISLEGLSDDKAKEIASLIDGKPADEKKEMPEKSDDKAKK